MEPSPRRSLRPVAIAAAVAAFGLLALLLVNHGPWNRPRVQDHEAMPHENTAGAAQAAGATVTPAEPRLDVEPTPPGPKPAHPAAPN
jgi:hypothetical protein